tara:strand:- start:510 stop:1043 length:534 start_codon:yes stop_codon:yes gene_type:complete
MAQVKLESKKIGVLGGTFDPAHKGHVIISKFAKKKYKINKIIWAITINNPFKNKSKTSIEKRIRFAKKLNSKNKFIKIINFEKKLKSNRTISLIKYLKRKYINSKIFFIIGADNLINFHKWKNYKNIINLCKIIVFDRTGYKKKALNSVAFRKFGNKTIEFVNFNKVNISSSKLRKI